jgi:hypothetical protein
MPETPAAAWAVVAEFDSAERLVAAVRKTREAGYRRIDTFTPFPIDEMPALLGFTETKVGWLTLAGGIFGAALAFGMQVYFNWDFPINVGGRPLYAVPAFLVVTFELTILFAVSFCVFGMLRLNRLPRLNHPAFTIPHFERASQDRFFLAIGHDDPRFDEARRFLESLAPLHVSVVAP